MNETMITGTDETRESKRASTRHRIVRSAAELLAEGGREAISKRAVAAAAGVQAPTIYRLFGDMRGLLDEVASFGFQEYLRGKVAREVVEDPVEDLRRGWDLHVGFGLDNPAFFTLMYGDPRPGAQTAADRESFEILIGLVQRVAEAGRLRVGVGRAARMIRATSSGVVLTLIAVEEEDRDPGLSEAIREATLAAVTTDAAPGPETGQTGHDRVPDRAVALKAVLPEAPAGFIPSERALLSDWLDRLADPPG
ncbi:MAG: Transcriptional regulator, AcrR family [uncultured Rubrobacteraceae bacterium]|uniref:Transcriptional regulator, AcrR family n=1 Tax=uncultured Rubrobacteraceae bacterium TaxID=349277 RepID=A0A6J4PBP5_9ACTN|nr:MAG: Transcriptional regulator, AcrR family [uncultured Rubrobacteraceae bacterium]